MGRVAAGRASGVKIFCQIYTNAFKVKYKKFAKTLLPPDSLDVDATYQDFCNIITKAAKKTIPLGYRLYVGMQSVNLSTEFSCSLLKVRLNFGCYSCACQARQKAEGSMVRGSSEH